MLWALLGSESCGGSHFIKNKKKKKKYIYIYIYIKHFAMPEEPQQR